MKTHLKIGLLCLAVALGMQAAGQAAYTRTAISSMPNFLEGWTETSDTAGFANFSVQRVTNLSATEQAKIRDIRSSIAFPTNATVFQKIISDTTGYTNTQRGVGGFIAVAADVKNLVTLDDVIQGMRLDYAGSPYVAGKSSYAVIRFQLPNVDNVRIPCARELAICVANVHYEPKADSWPFTGTGFTSSTLGRGGFPEYVIVGGYPLPNDGAEIYIVEANGNERRVLVLHAGKWKKP